MTTSICFVGMDNYPVLNPNYGGEYFGGESVQQTLLAKAFVRRGYRVSMVVKDHGQPDGEWIDGVRVWKAFADKAGLPVVRFLHPRLTGILGALRRADADVYYQSCASMQTGAVAWSCRRWRRRFVFRVAHDTDCIPGEQLIRFRRDRLLYEYGIRRAGLIASQGENQTALLAEHYGLDSVPVDMAVELPERWNTERDVDVLWVNNFRDFKRPERVLELARALPGVRFVMAGGAVPGYQALYDRITEEAWDLPNLELLGAVPYHEVNGYFLRSRVFINTSDSEGFPNSYLQAWARGMPVLTFFDPDSLIASHGLGEVPTDIDDMVGRLAAVLDDDGRRQEMGTAARAFVERRYAPDAVAAEYERFLGLAPEGADVRG